MCIRDRARARAAGARSARGPTAHGRRSASHLLRRGEGGVALLELAVHRLNLAPRGAQLALRLLRRRARCDQCVLAHFQLRLER
eukprot:2055940-Prymnesium_polylepis.1